MLLGFQVRHQDLKAAHDQLALTLQDHKSALAVAQVQRCILIKSQKKQPSFNLWFHLLSNSDEIY